MQDLTPMLSVSRTLTGDWSLIATGRVGPGVYFGAGLVGGVGNTGSPSFGSSAAMGLGRSIGGSFDYGPSGVEATRGFGGVGYGAYIAPIEFNLKLF